MDSLWLVAAAVLFGLTFGFAAVLARLPGAAP